MLETLRQALSHWPPHGLCLLCHQPADGRPLLCQHCEADLPRLSHPCPTCGHPLPEPAEGVCGRCLRHRITSYNVCYTKLLRTARGYLNPEQQITDAKAALDGARYILMERFAEQAPVLAALRERLWSQGIVQARLSYNFV